MVGYGLIFASGGRFLPEGTGGGSLCYTHSNEAMFLEFFYQCRLLEFKPLVVTWGLALILKPKVAYAEAHVWHLRTFQPRGGEC
jgi:hypothetical protein